MPVLSYYYNSVFKIKTAIARRSASVSVYFMLRVYLGGNYLVIGITLIFLLILFMYCMKLCVSMHLTLICGR